MPQRTTLTLTDIEAAERFRTLRDENDLSTDGALRRMLNLYENALEET